MFSYLLRQLFGSFGVFFRTIRAFFTRKVAGAQANVRRMTNFSRNATKVATASFQVAATAVKKPSKRADYIETKQLFVSKAFLFFLLIGSVVLVLLAYFVVWPFLLSHFFTAHFWQEDEKLGAWSGRVIVYYDEEKKIPMYRGELQDGVLQGLGEEYDEQGLLIYSGDFVDGARNGMGSAYDAGVLVYTGQFVNGVYEGMGSSYEDGYLLYRGTFAAGIPEGEGTAYYPDGERAYTGTFVQGYYEGEGTAYREDGTVLYRGSFAAGQYEGSGTLYLENGDQIRGTFAGGEADGAVQWYQDGTLWYEGGLTDETADGYGVLYAENGSVLYAGEFDRGTLDGAWLLTLAAEDLREAFGDATLVETSLTDGFLIEHPELGLTALCSYQQGEAQAQPYRLWLAPEAGTRADALLPWTAASEAERWAVAADPENPPQVTQMQGAAYRPGGVVEGDWYQTHYRYETYACTTLQETEYGAPVEILWSRDVALPSEPEVDAAVSQAQARLEELMAALNALESGESGESAGNTPSDLGDVERMLGLVLTAADGEELVDALTDYYVSREMLTALEGSQPLLEQNLAAVRSLQQRGSATQEEVDTAQSALDTLDRRLAQYAAAKEQARLSIQAVSKLDPEEYDLQKVLLCFDPVALDVEALLTSAQSYAKATAAQMETDAAALDREIKSAVLDLNMAYESIRSARETLERANAAVEEQMQSYAMGSGTKESLYEAQCVQNDAAAALLQATGTFTKEANRLNTLSGGWIAEEYDWMAGTFRTLFQSEIVRAQEAAQAAEEAREQAEQEAAQEIQEEQTQKSEESPDEDGGKEETSGSQEETAF